MQYGLKKNITLKHIKKSKKNKNFDDLVHKIK